MPGRAVQTGESPKYVCAQTLSQTQTHNTSPLAKKCRPKIPSQTCVRTYREDDGREWEMYDDVAAIGWEEKLSLFDKDAGWKRICMRIVEGGSWRSCQAKGAHCWSVLRSFWISGSTDHRGLARAGSCRSTYVISSNSATIRSKDTCECADQRTSGLRIDDLDKHPPLQET
jgi:hypothetical protein